MTFATGNTAPIHACLDHEGRYWPRFDVTRTDDWKQCIVCKNIPWHVHVSMQSRDCDGLYDHTYVASGKLEDINITWLDLTECGDGRFTHTVDDDYVHTIYLHAPTDEGFRSIEYVECNDPDCADQKSTYRDHTAEAAGY
jgi:hypothetical protein